MRDQINDPVRLSLIQEAIVNIKEYTSTVNSYEGFALNKLLCHAVTYNLQCIGECVYKLSREFKTAHPDMDWDAIEGMRHVLVHDYYRVDVKTIWAIVKNDIPALEGYLNRNSL